MSVPGVGFRFAADVLCEVSLHLIEPIVFTTASAFAQGGYGDAGFGENGYGDPIGSLLTVASQTAMYPGAMVVVGWGLPTQEVVTITEVNSDGTILTTPIVNFHSAGETILGPTFPYQFPTDQAFTQSEMLGYLSRAQNEFLADCPVNYSLSQQNLIYGQVYQNTPTNCIEINRIAASQYFCVISSITITDGEATVVTASPHGLQVGSTINVQNEATGFSGVFQVDSVPSPTSLTYPQDHTDGTADGGIIVYFARMYETTSAEITQTNRTWRNEYANVPTQWFEDRSGLYRWGVGAKPSSNFPVELLCSIRDTDTLGLLDGFLVPDTLVYAIKMKVLEYAWSKDGIQQDPSRAAYAKSRYDKCVMATNRFLLGQNLGLKAGA
jgi:hypothetical protein